MRKIFIFILTTFLLLAILCSCGNNSIKYNEFDLLQNPNNTKNDLRYIDFKLEGEIEGIDTYGFCLSGSFDEKDSTFTFQYEKNFIPVQNCDIYIKDDMIYFKPNGEIETAIIQFHGADTIHTLMQCLKKAYNEFEKGRHFTAEQNTEFCNISSADIEKFMNCLYREISENSEVLSQKIDEAIKLNFNIKNEANSELFNTFLKQQNKLLKYFSTKLEKYTDENGQISFVGALNNRHIFLTESKEHLYSDTFERFDYGIGGTFYDAKIDINLRLKEIKGKMPEQTDISNAVPAEDAMETIFALFSAK